MPRTKDVLKIVYRMVGKDRKLREMIALQSLLATIAESIYNARTKAGLTQKQLAELIGSTQSAIARLEDADYEGHSLSLLNRIAVALNKRVDLRLVPTKRTPQTA